LNWHTLSKEGVLKELGSDAEKGLSSAESSARLLKYGHNKTVEKAGKSLFEKFLGQFKDFMVIILLIAAAVSAATTMISGEHDWLEPLVIIAIVILNAALGVIQESKAETALEALKTLSAPHAKVKRDGQVQTIDAADLVPGDIILLEAGDFIPADARLIESASLKCEEASLTGESVPVEKDADAAVSPDAGLGDRRNMVFSGCSVTYGRGVVVVTSTGMSTEMGKIAKLLSVTEDTRTPLQLKLEKLGKALGVLVLGICAVIFVLGLTLGDKSLPLSERVMDMFMTSVSLAVSAIPEGLPAIVTVVLAIGVQRMVKKNAIIRRLPAVETLGSASVICSDKTGTLTQNRMTLLKIYDGERIVELGKESGERAEKVLLYGSLCSDGDAYYEDGKLMLVGDPTETAISAALLKYCGVPKKQADEMYLRKGEIPFDSDRKLMSTINEIDGKLYVLVKGAPDIVISRCSSVDAESALKANSQMAKEALRVLGVAYKQIDEIPGRLTSEEIESDLEFAGLVGMIDPPRKEAEEAVRVCQKAGIKVIMITGDHIETAVAIAKQLNILTGESQAIEGKQLAAMSDRELEENIERFSVYARVSPQDKIRIVQMWQKKGHVVAMTGDGVNDAPALKAADIGCAMGITGTDVAKGAAAMTLTDDNFATIVAAVKEGRGIYANIKKAVMFLLSCNFGEVVAIFFAILLGFKAPLTPLMLLWINLITDSLPALALGVEPIESNVMDQKPRSKEEGIFSGGYRLYVACLGMLIGVLTLSAYLFGLLLSGHSYGMSLAFIVLALSQLVHSYNMRSKGSVFKLGLFSNKYLNGAVLISALLMLIATLTPMRALFGVEQISAAHWLIAVALSLAPLLINEIAKLVQELLNKREEKSA